MTRKRPWAWTDAVALIGVLVLLVWVPMYVAQGEDEHTVRAQDGWDLRLPREGDRVVIDLVAVWEDGREELVAGVLEVSFKKLAPGEEGPRPAVWAEERIIAGVNVTVGGLQVLAEPRIETVYYDAQGEPVYQTKEGVYARTGAHPQTFEVESQHRRIGDLMQQRGLPARFVSSSSALQAISGTLTSSSDLEGQSVYGRSAAVYDDRLMYAADGEHLMNKVPVLGRGDWSVCSGGSTTSVSTTWHLGMQLRTFGGHCRGVGWDWYVEDFPVPVGRHMAVHTSSHRAMEMPKLDERLGHVDFVPGLVERGQGETFPMARYASTHQLGQEEPSSDQRTVSVASLKRSDQPLLYNASLSDVAALFDEPGVPSSVRSLWEDDAAIAAFIWADRGLLENEVEGAGLPEALTGLLGEAVGPSVSHAVTWEVELVTADGDWTIAGMSTSMQEDGSVELVEMVDLCRDGDRDCEPDAMADVRLEDRVVPPQRLVEAARERLGGEEDPVEMLFYAPLYEEARHSFPVRYGSVLVPDGAMGVRSVLSPTMEGGVAVWSKNWAPDEDGWMQVGAYNLADGSEVAQLRWRTLEDPPSYVQAAPVEGAVRPVELAPALGWLGLVLIVFAVASRVLRTLWGGGLLPFIAVGYAKIARSEVLTQERRRAIMDLLDAEPGLTVTQVHKRLGYGWGATVHHLETLAKSDEVTSMQNGRRRHYFPLKGVPAEKRLRAVLEHDPLAKRLLEAVALRPRATAGELAPEVGRSRSGVVRTAQRLERLGLLQASRDGRKVRYEPVEEGLGSVGHTAGAPVPEAAASG